MRINKDDLVVVLAGADRGSRGRVISVNREAETVTVEGINTVHKHVKRSKRNPQGGRLTMEMSVPQSKVQVICTSCSKPARIGAKILDDGSKYRVCKKCGARLSQISPAKNK
ncbi:MAG: 50S ribosomal protein L24 [Thermoguttaceae bacterium]